MHMHPSFYQWPYTGPTPLQRALRPLVPERALNDDPAGACPCRCPPPAPAPAVAPAGACPCRCRAPHGAGNIQGRLAGPAWRLAAAARPLPSPRAPAARTKMAARQRETAQATAGARRRRRCWPLCRARHGHRRCVRGGLLLPTGRAEERGMWGWAGREERGCLWRAVKGGSP